MSRRPKRLRKRVKRNRRQRPTNYVRTNLHHLLWLRAKWDKNTYARAIRHNWYFKVLIPAETLHKAIHQEIPNGIPMPSVGELKEACMLLAEMDRNGDLREDDNVMIRSLVLTTLFDKDTATYKALRKQYDIIVEFYTAENPS